jgi:hypothetical protein
MYVAIDGCKACVYWGAARARALTSHPTPTHTHLHTYTRMHAHSCIQKPKPFDPNNFDPVAMAAQGKRGKPLMVIVELIEHFPTKTDAEEALRVWVDGLRQAFVPNTGYVLGTNQYLFNLDEGSHVAEAKAYLLTRPNVRFVQIDQQEYYPGDPTPKPANTGSSSSGSGSKKRKAAAKPKKANKAPVDEL